MKHINLLIGMAFLALISCSEKNPDAIYRIAHIDNVDEIIKKSVSHPDPVTEINSKDVNYKGYSICITGTNNYFPTSVTFNYGDVVDGVGFNYYDRMSIFIGSHNGTNQNFYLDSDEYLVEVYASRVKAWNCIYYNNISFVTNKGDTLGVTSTLSDSTDIKLLYKVKEGNAIVGMNGYVYNYVEDIQFYETSISGSDVIAGPLNAWIIGGAIIFLAIAAVILIMRRKGYKLFFLLFLTLIACDYKSYQIEKINATGSIERSNYYPELSLKENPRVVIYDGFPVCVNGVENCFPTSIFINISNNTIAGIGFNYGKTEYSAYNSQYYNYGRMTIPVGKTDQGYCQEFRLASGEYLTEAYGTYMKSEDIYLFETIGFITNKGNTFEVSFSISDSSTGDFRYKVKEGNAIFCIFGSGNTSFSSAVYLNSLGFYEKKINGVSRSEITAYPAYIWIIGGIVSLLIIAGVVFLIIRLKGYKLF